MDIFAYVFAMCKFTEVWRPYTSASYTSLHKRTRRCQATSLLPSSEAKSVPVQFFSTNFNILKAAPICTTWRGSKGAVSVVVADRRSGKHQSWLHADTGIETGHSFSCLFARRDPTHNFWKILDIRVMQSILDGNISGVRYSILLINLYKQLQFVFTAYLPCR